MARKTIKGNQGFLDLKRLTYYSFPPKITEKGVSV